MGVNFGAHVRLKRKEKDLTVEQMAEELGISPERLYVIEQGGDPRGCLAELAPVVGFDAIHEEVYAMALKADAECWMARKDIVLELLHELVGKCPGFKIDERLLQE